MIRKSLCALAVTTAAMAFASQADAMTDFKFYSGGVGSPLTAVAPNAGFSCTGDADRCGSTLTYTNGGISLDATSTSDDSGATVWHDLVPSYGGLGVGATSSTENIDIGASDVLKLNFTTGPVNIMGLELYNHANSAGNPIVPTGKFKVVIDGSKTVLADFTAAGSFNETGTMFEFTHSQNVNEGGGHYYLSAFEATAVPIPAALPLFATALAGLGIFGWRKKSAQAA
jgi:hypothetical protein